MPTNTITFARSTESLLCLKASFFKTKKLVLFTAAFFAFVLLTAQAIGQPAPTLSYPSPQTFTVGTAVSLAPASSNVKATGFANGFNSGSSAYSVALAFGNQYIGQTNGIIEETTSGGTNIQIGSGLGTISSLAADASNNVYYTTLGGQNVMEIPAGSHTPVTFFNCSSCYVSAVAVDSAGYVYYSDRNDGYIKKIDPHTGSVAGSFVGGSPTAFTVDGLGYVYAANVDNILKFSPGGANLGSINSGLTSLSGVAVDPSGNIFAASSSSNAYLSGKLNEIPAGTSTPVVLFPYNNIVGNFTGIATDANDNLIAVADNSNVYQIFPTGGYYLDTPLPAGLSFNSSTGVISGTPTAAAPAKKYVVWAYNFTTGSVTSQVYYTADTLSITVNTLNINSLRAATALAPPYLTNASTVNYQAVFNIPVTGLTAGNFSIITTGASSATVGTPSTGDGGITWTVPVTNISGSGTLQLALANSTGLSAPVATTLPFTGDTYTIDQTPPTVTIGAPSASSVLTGSVSFPVTYADANFGSSNLTSAGITLNTTGTANGTVGVTGSGTAYTVTISTISGNGTLGISVGSGYAADLAGNTDAGAGPSATVTDLVNVPPAISYTGPQVYAQNSTILPLTPVISLGMNAFASQPYASNSLGLDYNGNAYVISNSSEIIQYRPGNSNPFPLPANSNANIAIAPISATVSTLMFPFNGSVRAMDINNGMFNPPVTVCPTSGTGNLVAATHPASGPEIAMVNKGFDPGGQIAFLTRTGGVWSSPSIITNAFPGSAMAINNYPGGLKLAFVGLDNNLYYATYSGGSWSAVAPWAAPNISLSGVVAFALDAQGNVWYGNGTSLNELIPGSTSPLTVATLPSAPNAIAFDVAGNLDVNLGTIIEKLTVTNNFQVSPALPAGLSINSSTGVISGTPTATSAAANYTVTANNSAGGTSATINIQVIVPLAISYSGPNAYPINTAIAPLTPVQTVNASVFASTVPGTHLALDYNGNAYIQEYGDGSSNFYQYAPGSSTPVAVPGFSTTSLTAAPISSTNSTLLSWSGSGSSYVMKALDIANGQFQQPVALFSSAQFTAFPFVAAVHPASGPEIAMVNVGYDAGQITFFTRTAGVWSGATYLPNNPVSPYPAPYFALAMNNYQGGFKLAYVAGNGQLYYATYSGGAWSAVSPWGAPNINLSNLGQENTVAFALDAQGNVWYATDASLNELIPGSTTPITVATLPSKPVGIAFDAAGNLYVNLGTTIEKLTVTNNFKVSPALPAGLSINSASGVISGTPIGVSPATNYTVTATTGSGTFTTTVNIQTITTPTLSYGSAVNTAIGTAITPVTPTSTNILPQKYNSTPTVFANVTAPTGLATDAAGNVFVADNSYNIDKFTPGSASPISLGSGYGPLATDGTGNFYFTNLSNGVYQFNVIQPGSTTIAYQGPAVTTPVSVSSCTGIGIDAAGNAYVSTNNANESVIEYTNGLPINAQGLPFAIGNGFSSVSGLATDPAGNIYVSDAGAGTIDVIPASRAQWTTLATGLGAPANICIDGAGNLYYSDNVANTVSELPAGSTTPVVIASGLGTIKALAIDGKGNLYAADYTNNVIDRFNPMGGYYINPVLPPGMSFNGSTGVIGGTPTAPTAMGAAVNYTVTAYNTLGSASAVQNLAVTTALPVVSYGSARTFIVGNAIAPLTPASTGVAMQGYNLVPGFMDFQFGAPYAVAVDTSLNVVVADPYNFNTMSVSSDYDVTHKYYGNVLFAKGKGEWRSISGGEAYTNGLFCVATDSTGNIVTTSGSIEPKEYKPFPDLSVIGGFPGVLPLCISADSHGNFFEAIPGNGTVAQLAFTGNTTIASGFIQPTGIAIDGTGNIFVGDRGNNTLYKIPAGSSTQTAVATGFNAPYQLAADGTGNIFIGDGGNGVIKELPAGGGPVITVIPNLKTPNGVAVDVKGALYVADAGFAQVRKYTPSGGYYISPSLPAGLSFNNSTGVISGTPTVVTPIKDYKITAYNASGSTQSTLRFGVTLPNSDLANLAVSTGTLSPAFATGTLGYSVSVPYATTQIAVTPTAVDGTAPVTVNGAAVAYGSTSAPLPLQVGANTINVVVIASDNSSTKTYTVTVTRAAPSNNALLSNVGLGYITDGSGNTYAIVTPAAAGVGATITVNGTTVASGTPSSPILLSPGSNTVVITVTAQNGVTKLTYKITVMGPLSGISTLSALTISAGTLSSAFSSNNTSYADAVDTAVTSLKLTPTTADPNATVTVNGTAVISGTASGNIVLPLGNTVIPTVVTAQDGVTNTTYTVTVTRALSADATLAALSISSGTLRPAFATGTTTYAVSVANSVTSVLVRPTAAYATATIKVNGTTVVSGAVSRSIPLSVGTNIINAVVTAQDGVTTKTYTITVTRAAPMSTIATLSNFTISSGALSPAFATATTNYAVSVASSVTSVLVKPTATNATATIKVNGITVASGAVSGSIPLAVGANTINAVVTAQDGVTTDTYTVTVTRAAPLSTIATLSNFTISNGTLSPAFATATTSYAVSVANSVTSVLVRPTTTDATATIKVNGTTVASGTVSGSIPLNVGTNTISAVVTAQDGVTTKTYTITVTRAGTLSAIATLSNFTISSGTLSPAFATATTNYAVSVANSVTSVLVRSTATDATATIKVNGTTVASGTVSGSIPLAVGTNTISSVVTAQDGVTTKTYTVTVTRAASLSTIATLGNFTISIGNMSPAFATATTSYAVSVANSVTSVLVRPTATDATATVKVNGTTVASGTVSGSIPLAVGANTISTVVTAQDRVTTKTYTTTVTRAMSGMNSLYLPGNGEQTAMVSNLTENVKANNILSPNGDGINDIWVVKNIAFYPDNIVTVFDRAGKIVFTRKGYANDWGGTYRGSVLSDGTYHYIIDLGNGTNIIGFITVVNR